ncbi:MAG TPA: hypothetical protein VFV50_15230 [Bdellovibrionales bacterium]|nr:hypothetical protein [Bdellovibrionales bacterium]
MTAARSKKPAARSKKPSLKLIRGGKSEKPAVKKQVKAKAAAPKPVQEKQEKPQGQAEGQAKAHPFARFIFQQRRPDGRSYEPSQRWYQQPPRKKAV